MSSSKIQSRNLDPNMDLAKESTSQEILNGLKERWETEDAEPINKNPVLVYETESLTLPTIHLASSGRKFYTIVSEYMPQKNGILEIDIESSVLVKGTYSSEANCAGISIIAVLGLNAYFEKNDTYHFNESILNLFELAVLSEVSETINPSNSYVAAYIKNRNDGILASGKYRTDTFTDKVFVRVRKNFPIAILVGCEGNDFNTAQVTVKKCKIYE